MSRYIDADVFEVFDYTSQDGTFDDGVQFVLEKIDEQPTADVVDRNECSKCVFYPFRQLKEQQETNMAEVVHGEWQVYYDEDSPQDGIWKCSICNYIKLIDDISPTNYCPNCGADMRGGR